MQANQVYIVGGNSQYSEMYRLRGWVETDTMDKADLVQFCGGADVHPSFYGEDTHPQSMCDKSRDEVEAFIFSSALLKNIPMAGICRGGQFLNVMSGGSMFQHVNNHGLYGTHKVKDEETGEVYSCTSTHHQMMCPLKESLVVALAYPKLSTYKEYVSDGCIVHQDHHMEDYEVVYYLDTNCLCFQPHPEFDGVSECTDYYFSLIERFFGL